jgi:hypothetical protein
MVVFVVGTGRCGTCTAFHAFSHATNKTVGHESSYWNDGINHRYKDNHIEIGHTLTLHLSWLIRKYPSARFIHLQREADSCIKSLYKQGLGTIDTYYRATQGVNNRNKISIEATKIYYEEINSRIQDCVPSNRYFHVWLHDLPRRWKECWKWAECEGQFSKSKLEWSRRYNYDGKGVYNYVEKTT